MATKTKWITAIFFLGVILILGITGAVESIREEIGKLFDFRSRTTVMTSPTIIKQIEPLGQLVTIEAQYAKANIAVNKRWGAVNVCSITNRYVAQITIQAGINFVEIDEDDIRYDEATETYHITLPPAQLTSCNLDPMQTQEYVSNSNFPCSVDSDQMRRVASYTAINEFREDALESGILLEAQNQADLLIGNFISTLTGKAVVIEFEQSQTVQADASCRPAPPNDLRYDTEGGFWFSP